jgi:hypothetical protein
MGRTIYSIDYRSRGTMSSTVLKRVKLVAHGFILLTLAIAIGVTQRPDDPVPVVAQAGEPAFNPLVDVYFPDTGQTTRGPFLAYWYANREIGSPVSPPVVQNGRWTQWFQFARLELVDLPLEQGTRHDLTPVPIGEAFAKGVGYADRLDAFQRRSDGPDRFFPETGHSIQQGFRVAYETSGMAEQLGLPISEEFSIGKTVYQFFLRGALSWQEGTAVQRVALGVLDAGLHGRLGSWQERPQEAVELGDAGILELSRLLLGERWIDINLRTGYLTAYVGNYPVLESYVDVGHPNSPTVKGTFSIYLKNRVQTLRGETWDGTPYLEPDVPYVMYFYQDYAIHPSSWRTSFGAATSPGCVIPPLEVATLLWDWADYGTIVYVH